MKNFQNFVCLGLLLAIQTTLASDNLVPADNSEQAITTKQELPQFSTDEYTYSKTELIMSSASAKMHSKDLTPTIETFSNWLNTGKTIIKRTFEPLDEDKVKIVTERWESKKVSYATKLNLTAGAILAIALAKLGWDRHAWYQHHEDFVKTAGTDQRRFNNTFIGSVDGLSGEGERVNTINNINYQDSEGNTALHQAVRGRKIKNIYEILNYQGADTNIKNKEGKTAADLVAGIDQRLHRLVSLQPNENGQYDTYLEEDDGIPVHRFLYAKYPDKG